MSPSSIHLSHDRSEFPMVLVANKADLEGERVVSFQDGEGLAQELKVQWNSAEERASTCHTPPILM